MEAVDVGGRVAVRRKRDAADAGPRVVGERGDDLLSVEHQPDAAEVALDVLVELGPGVGVGQIAADGAVKAKRH